MRLVVNGIENGTNSVIRGADLTLNFVFCEDDGTPTPLGGTAVVTVEMYPSPARDVTPTSTLSPTVGAGAAAGICQSIIEDTTTLARGQYYLSGVWKSDGGTGVGTTVKISTGFDILIIG